MRPLWTSLLCRGGGRAGSTQRAHSLSLETRGPRRAGQPCPRVPWVSRRLLRERTGATTGRLDRSLLGRARPLAPSRARRLTAPQGGCPRPAAAAPTAGCRWRCAPERVASASISLCPKVTPLAGQPWGRVSIFAPAAGMDLFCALTPLLGEQRPRVRRRRTGLGGCQPHTHGHAAVGTEGPQPHAPLKAPVGQLAFLQQIKHCQAHGHRGTAQ